MGAPDLPRMTDGFRQRGSEVTRIEAFVDAAFAFAVTLLVISIDTIPGSRDELVLAMKGIPAFAVSFGMIALFWYGHARHTQRYGLDDTASVLMSLVLVFLVLVFVYPLKVMFASFFSLVTSGYLPANYAIESSADWVLVFVVFGVAFASMGTVLALLTRHAWKQREALDLDLEERIATRCYELSWWLIPAVSLLSISLALLARLFPEQTWLMSMPGPVYMVLGVQSPFILAYGRRLRRMLASQGDTTGTA
jgi:uncharacterized membrane protein